MNTINPGFVENYEVDETTRNRIPMGRPAGAPQIAAIVVYLLTDNSSSITGLNNPVTSETFSRRRAISQ